MSYASTDTGELVEVKAIPLGLIDNGPAVRRELLDDGHATALAENVHNLPNIVVRPTGDRYQLIDGRHRLAAHKFARLPTITAEVREMDDRQALIAAMHANVTHGRALSLTERVMNAKRLLVEASDLSNREIARICGLSHATVGKYRAEDSGQGGQFDHPEPDVEQVERAEPSPAPEPSPAAGVAPEPVEPPAEPEPDPPAEVAAAEPEAEAEARAPEHEDLPAPSPETDLQRLIEAIANLRDEFREDGPADFNGHQLADALDQMLADFLMKDPS